MQSRDAMDSAARHLDCVTPIQLVSRSDILRAKQPSHANRNNEYGVSTRRQPAQRGEIEVIIVIVADQYRVDAR